MKFWITLFCTGLVACSLSSATSAQLALRPKTGSVFASLPKITPEIAQWLLASSRSYKLSKVGDGFAKQGDWQNAQDSYQQALDLYPTNRDALYGMAECNHVAGDANAEIGFYRKVVYSTNPADKGFGETDPEKLMQFVLLLSQAGDTDEALVVYHHAAALLNYMDGKQNIPVMLPALGFAPDQLPYTPKRLQALAHVGIAVKTQDSQNERTHLDEAIRLQPDMAAAYFYRGRQALRGQPGHFREAREAFRTALLYGDAGTKAEVEKAMKNSSVEYYAESEQDMEDLHKKRAVQKK